MASERDSVFGYSSYLAKSPQSMHKASTIFLVFADFHLASTYFLSREGVCEYVDGKKNKKPWLLHHDLYTGEGVGAAWSEDKFWFLKSS